MCKWNGAYNKIEITSFKDAFITSDRNLVFNIDHAEHESAECITNYANPTFQVEEPSPIK